LASHATLVHFKIAYLVAKSLTLPNRQSKLNTGKCTRIHPSIILFQATKPTPNNKTAKKTKLKKAHTEKTQENTEKQLQ